MKMKERMERLKRMKKFTIFIEIGKKQKEKPKKPQKISISKTSTLMKSGIMSNFVKLFYKVSSTK